MRSSKSTVIIFDVYENTDGVLMKKILIVLLPYLFPYICKDLTTY